MNLFCEVDEMDSLINVMVPGPKLVTKSILPFEPLAIPVML